MLSSNTILHFYDIYMMNSFTSINFCFRGRYRIQTLQEVEVPHPGANIPEVVEEVLIVGEQQQ